MELGGYRTRGYDVGYSTDVGRQRSRNEDNYFVCSVRHDIENHGLVFAVADGMGGHQGGALASRLAVETIGTYYDEAGGGTSLDETISTIIRRANDTIRTRSSLDTSLARMGTTLTMALVHSRDKVRIWHIGDCRAFRIRQGKIHQVTQDHSLVADQVRLGILSPEEAENHPARNVITRALGTRTEVSPDVYEEEFLPGDRLVICCDGLHGVVGPDEMLEIALGSEDARTSCKRMVDRANELGGPDNITVVQVHYQEHEGLWPWVDRVFSTQPEG